MRLLAALAVVGLFLACAVGAWAVYETQWDESDDAGRSFGEERAMADAIADATFPNGEYNLARVVPGVWRGRGVSQGETFCVLIGVDRWVPAFDATESRGLTAFEC